MIRKVTKDVTVEIFVIRERKLPLWERLVEGYSTIREKVPAREGQLEITVGSDYWQTAKIWTAEELKASLDQSSDFPVSFVGDGFKTLWRFDWNWYWADEELDADEVHAILVARRVRAKKSIDRAKSIAGMAVDPPKNNLRGHIAADLRQVIWMRDGGACTICGSKVELQFDHIIPVSMGGATTEENLQILCGPCNRTKGSSVG